MKKFLIASNAVLLLALATIVLTGCPDPSPNQGGATTNGSNCYSPATGTGFTGLNAMLVYHLAKNYRNKQLAVINNSNLFTPTNGDARSVWFDLETVKRFIYMIESTTCNNCNNSNSKRLGIRIYYGTYPQADAWNDSSWRQVLNGVPQSFAGRHTVMMVPTYEKTTNGTTAEIDFDPNYITAGCDFTAIESFYDSMKTNPPANVTLSVLSSINSTAQNHGEMVPPPYDNNQILDKGAGIMFAVDQY